MKISTKFQRHEIGHKMSVITIYNTVISTEAGDKVFEPGFFFLERFRDFLMVFLIRA